MSARLVRCVVFSLLAFMSAPLWAASAEPAARALHLLGYLGADYPATVANGEVVDASEYREQLEFLGVLQELLLSRPDHRQPPHCRGTRCTVRHTGPDRAAGRA